RKARPDVLVGAIRAEFHRSRPATHMEVSLGTCLHALPLQEHGLRTALTGHETDGLPIDNLGLWIDTRASPVPESVAYDLSQVAHELVVALKLVAFDADDRAVVCHADQEVATFGVQERRDRLQHGVSHA